MKHTCAVAAMLLLCGVAGPGEPGAQQAHPRGGVTGISGYVLDPDGTPVTFGTVSLFSRSAVRAAVTAVIDRAGRFRVVPDSAGVHQLLVSAPGLTPQRLDLWVPSSRDVTLPVLRLLPGSYFRVRFASAAGEVVAPRRLRLESLDASGAPIPVPPDHLVEQIDGDGTMTVGPLPVGRTMFALDNPAFALTRLPDLEVVTPGVLLDGGIVVVERGAVFHVEIVDELGVALTNHYVFLEEAVSPSPLGFRRAQTDEQGRARFDRVAAGRYRLRTRAAAPCGVQPLNIGRVVAVPGSGAALTRLVVGGQASFRVTTPVGPIGGAPVAASPESGASPSRVVGVRPPLPLSRVPAGPVAAETSCTGFTDGEGRVTLASFPPGPARFRVRLTNSTYERTVTVPDEPRDIPVVIPEGFLQVRVLNALTKQGIGNAALTFAGGGARVEARTVGTGDALLEGVGAAGGTLEATAAGHEPAQVKLLEPPASTVELALAPSPPGAVRARVMTTAGEPVARAVLQLVPHALTEVPQVAVADANGMATFQLVSRASLRLMASADGFVAAGAELDSGRGEVVVTLTRGHRIVANVPAARDTDTYLVRVVDERGVPVDGLLDAASDRRIVPPARLSLGPLAPGTYVVELHGGAEPRRQRVLIVDRDVAVTF